MRLHSCGGRCTAAGTQLASFDGRMHASCGLPSAEACVKELAWASELKSGTTHGPDSQQRCWWESHSIQPFWPAFFLKTAPESIESRFAYSRKGLGMVLKDIGRALGRKP